MIERRIVLITGATSGIGLKTALQMAQQGMIVFMGHRDEKKLPLKKYSNIYPLKLDVRSDDDIKKAYETLYSFLKKGDQLTIVNNAGMTEIAPIESLDRQHWKHILDINTISPFILVRTFLPLLRRYDGKIINISSTSGLVAWPFAGAYAASKFALEAASESLRIELKPFDIPVIVVNPGAIKTPIWKKVEEQANTLPLKLKPYYEGRFKTTLDIILKGIKNNGISSQVVAAKITKIVLKKKCRSRYLIGRSAYLQYYLNKFIPEKVYSFLKYYIPERAYKKERDYS
ncbi:MAG: SDR family NAD(P)-dependent oxidoreductase, partial [Bacteroidetes bacterium]